MLSISNHFFIPYLLWQEVLLNIWIRFSFLNTAGSRICRKGGTGKRALNMSHYPHVVHKITNCHDYSRRFVVEAGDDWMYAYITGTMIHIRLCMWLWVIGVSDTVNQSKIWEVTVQPVSVGVTLLRGAELYGF